MRRKYAHKLYPLNKSCSAKVTFKFTEEEQNYFIEYNKIIGRGVRLSYNNFSKEFIIQMNDIKMQLRD